MKQALKIALIGGMFLIIMAFSNVENKSEGALGDVKYSILPPDKFREENGIGWVLMDDNIPIQNSALKLKHGIVAVPDARGIFIRSLNLTRGVETGDTYKQENNSDRLAGSYQSDMLKSHNHHYRASDRREVSGRGSASDFAWDSKEYTTTATGGLETRPKNIALYTYIKINE